MKLCYDLRSGFKQLLTKVGDPWVTSLEKTAIWKAELSHEVGKAVLSHTV